MPSDYMSTTEKPLLSKNVDFFFIWFFICFFICFVLFIYLFHFFFIVEILNMRKQRNDEFSPRIPTCRYSGVTCPASRWSFHIELYWTLPLSESQPRHMDESMMSADATRATARSGDPDKSSSELRRTTSSSRWAADLIHAGQGHLESDVKPIIIWNPVKFNSPTKFHDVC